jgi:hypothetical protein
MNETVTNYRRIDRLKAKAHEQGFTNEDAKQFGKLSKTATWEALLETYCISLQSIDLVDSVDRVLDTVLDNTLDTKLDNMLDTKLDNTLEPVDTNLEPVGTVDSVGKRVDSKTQSLDTSDWTYDASFPLCNFTPQNSTNFLKWVDFGQLFALFLASVGLFVLAMSLWRQINPLNLFPPVKVNIQIGTKL